MLRTISARVARPVRPSLSLSSCAAFFSFKYLSFLFLFSYLFRLWSVALMPGGSFSVIPFARFTQMARSLASEAPRAVVGKLRLNMAAPHEVRFRNFSVASFTYFRGTGFLYQRDC